MDLNIKKILVGISGSSRKVLAAAAELGRKAKARIELMSVVRPPGPMYGLSEGERHNIARAAAAAQLRALERLARPLRASGLTVGCHVEISSSVTEGLLRHIARSKPTLVAIEAHKHNVLSRLLLTQTDFNLVRYCPVPLLIVKNRARVRRAAVLAALDPSQANRKPATLDTQIVTAARGLSRLLGGSLQGAHVYPPLVGYVGDAMFAPVAIPISMPEQKKYVNGVRTRFKAFCARYRIKPRNVHLRMGDPAIELPSLARSARARVVVMGAVSRNFLKRTLLGSTAEQALDAMPCDILVIKPKQFRAAA
jgi:universal stress protein E